MAWGKFFKKTASYMPNMGDIEPTRNSSDWSWLISGHFQLLNL
jgi:hypothetical protein